MYYDDKEKDVILKDEYFDLKITSDRQIYYKLKNMSTYSLLIEDKKVPLGYSLDDKKKLLMLLNEKIKTNFGNEIDAIINGDTKSPDNNQEQKSSYSQEKNNSYKDGGI